MPRYRLHVPIGVAPARSSGRAPRTASLDGRRIALLWNGKPNGDVYLDALHEFLRDRVADADVLTLGKPSSSQPAPPSILEQLLSCHAVITALGD